MIELAVNNMTCNHCVSAVTRAVKSVDPKADVQVDLERKRVRIDGTSSVEALGRALEEAGYPATPTTEKNDADRVAVGRRISALEREAAAREAG